MVDFAQLGIQVNSEQAVKAASDLDKLAASGARAEKATDELKKASSDLSGDLKKEASSAKEAASAIDLEAKALERQNGIRDRLIKVLSTERGQRILESQNVSRSTSAINAQSQSMQAAGMSARAYNAAMRNVPAQITDITTSLIGGQPAYLVAIQQGGQLKDMFGGIVPAARALATSLLGMINPLTITAAIVGTLGVAFYQASARTEEINLALISTGRNARYTAEGIEKLAASIDSVSGVTQGGAISAITSLATTTNLTGEALTSASAAAASWASVTGQSADTVLDKFRAIAKDPVNALTKLNETERFLTETQYQRIKALQDEGRWQEAATEAAKLYADVVAGRTREVEANLGLISTAWLNIKQASSDAWDAVVVGVDKGLGPLQRYADKLAEIGGIQRDLISYGTAMLNLPLGILSRFGGNASAGRPEVIMPGVDGETRSPASVRNEQEIARAKAANDAWQAVIASTDKNIQQQREIQRIREAGKAAGQSEEAIQKQIDAYTASIAKSSASSAASTRTRKVDLTDEQKAAQALSKNYESITAQLERQIALSGDNTQLGRINYEISSGNLQGLGQGQQDNLRNLAGVADIEADYQAIYGGMDTLQVKSKETTDVLSQYGVQAARNMQSAFADFLFDPFDKGLGGMAKGFADTLKRMAAEAAAAEIFKAIGQAASNYQGGGSSWVNAIGQIFSAYAGSGSGGGGYANGGYTGPGGKYEVAGYVHRDEVVWNKEDVKAVGGPRRANAMRPTSGYASGGIVGGSSGMSNITNAQPNVEININMDGGNVDSQTQNGTSSQETMQLVNMIKGVVSQWYTEQSRTGGVVYRQQRGMAG